jgi:hypothetical protein
LVKPTQIITKLLNQLLTLLEIPGNNSDDMAFFGDFCWRWEGSLWRKKSIHWNWFYKMISVTKITLA